MAIDANDDVRAAFGDGRLYLRVEARGKYSSEWSGHVRAREAMALYGCSFQTVHVISRPAGGEIRGYIQIDGGALLLRTPAYPPDWPELDCAVSEELGVPVVVEESPDA